jgi:hypothetical protein
VQSGDGFAASNCGYTGAKLENGMVLGVDVIHGGGGVPLKTPFFDLLFIFFYFFSFFYVFLRASLLRVLRIQYPMNLLEGLETARERSLMPIT